VNEFTTEISTAEQHGLQPKICTGTPFGHGKFSRLWRAEHHEINLDLTCVNQRFYINQLALNITKTNVIKFTPKTTAQFLWIFIFYLDKQLVAYFVTWKRPLSVLIMTFYHLNWNYTE
jgi:hypothetical protein